MLIQFFFFIIKCVKVRSNSILLKALNVGEEWVLSPVDVIREVVNFFTSYTSSISGERPKIDGVSFVRLSEDQNRELVAIFEIG